MPGFPGVGRFFLYRVLFLKETASQLDKAYRQKRTVFTKS